jgi:hypothetical protein
MALPTHLRRFLFAAASVALISVPSLGLGGCQGEGEGIDDADGEDEPGISEGELNSPRATGPLTFSDECRAGKKITIAAMGDVLLHGPLQKQAYASREGFHSLWSAAEPLIAKADVAYANFEGPAAAGVTSSGTAVTDPGKVFDGRVYSSYPMFNYHPSLASSLLESGVDVVSTANNHALDRRSLGADRTIDVLNNAGLKFTGTRASNNREQPWYTVTNKGGVKLAWVACTFSTNGIPDTKNQVLHCYEDTAEIESNIRNIRANGIADAVIVTPHWGTEYTHTPGAEQKRLAKRLLDAGAIAILGGHPHVVQPWEKYTTTDGRETFIIYSLGNFVSGQSQLPRRSSLMLYLGLTKGNDGKVTVNGVRYVPLTMRRWTVEPSDKAQGAADSRALTEGIFGKWNAMASDAPLNTTPNCR